MNICILSQRYPYKDNMEFVFVKKLVDEWAKMGHQCTIVTMFSLTTFLRKRIKYKPRYYQYEVSSGTIVKVFNPRFISFQKTSIKGVSLDDWVSARMFERLMRRLDNDFDVIYCHFFITALTAFRYAKKNDIPLFVATGESQVPLLKKPYASFRWEDFRDYTKGVISVSGKNVIEAVEKEYADENKCRVFPNATDTSIFKPLNKADCRKKLGYPDDVFIIACVGFFCERKGQNRVLEAVRKLREPKIRLIFLGTPAKIGSVDVEGEEILFKGSVDNGSLPVFLAASDIFCLPTLAEGCCNAIIEALACGLPIVSSDLPFNKDILDESNSILVDPTNTDELALTIQKLMNTPSLCSELAMGSLSKGESLDIRRRASDILQFMDERKQLR